MTAVGIPPVGIPPEFKDPVDTVDISELRKNVVDLKIPPEFRDSLEAIEIGDHRSDEEILQSLTKHVPVTSEKNVWAFWHAGVRSMPAWCQRNVIDWVRICGSSGWTIRVLDSRPGSPNHPFNFVEPKLLPECFKQGTMKGPWTGPHSADFLRGALLWTHGGVSMDVGIILIRDLDRVCWNKMTEPDSPYRIATQHMWGQTISNFFVAARKGDPFIKRWHDLFTHLWAGRQTHEGLTDDPLISLATEIVSEDMQATRGIWDVAVPYKTVMEYITQLLCWQRLCMLEDAGDGFSCADYWMKHIFILDALREGMGGDTMVGFEAQKMYRYLTMKRDAPNTPDYKSAYELIWYILTESSMLKIVHGKGLTHTKCLGTLLDEPENEGKSYERGTFFELLRYGSVHFKQTRDNVRAVEQWKPKVTLKKGLLEP